jgi:uncharacterized protein YwgA
MSYQNAVKVAAIVRDAGGRIVGRTKLQKIAYLLTASGLETGLPFSYKHFGPFSEDVAVGARDADLLGLLREEEHQAAWGGFYSVYTVGETNTSEADARSKLASEAAQADSVELELAATALLLANEGYRDPWSETERRKPEKTANGRIERAKQLYRRLSSLPTPHPWPNIS